MSNRFYISGTTGGLGKAFAVECARRGWDLFLTDLDRSSLETLSAGLRCSFLVDVDYFPADLTDDRSRDELFSHLDSLGISFSGLVNVAGLYFEGSFLEISRPSLRTILRLNIESTLEVTHFLLSHASPLAPFRVVTVASLSAFYPMPFKATYAASKPFLYNFSLALREEIRDRNATVAVLCPACQPTTSASIHSIDAQGVMGHTSTENIGGVVSRTLVRALQGRPLVIPGFVNQLLMSIGSLLPAALLARLIHRRWSRAQRRKQTAQTEAQFIT